MGTSRAVERLQLPPGVVTALRGEAAGAGRGGAARVVVGRSVILDIPGADEEKHEGEPRLSSSAIHRAKLRPGFDFLRRNNAQGSACTWISA